jgi:NAD(P)-dependent dehydrogenase (short-subunit alcohol dehydrogenase family)
MKFTQSSAVVTGGASGLGEATVRALAAKGAHVVLIDLQDEKGEKLAAEVGATYARADVTSEAEVSAAIDTALSFGPLRALVSCAGIGGAARTIGRDGEYSSAFPLDKFTRIVTVNLIGSFNCARLAATAMSRSKPDESGERGAIVNTASVAAFEGQVGQAGYSASKGGIVALTLPLARDLAPAGIRVNTIAPGLIDTPMYNGFADPEAMKAKLAENVVYPRRLGMPAEFAELAVSLLSNTYMNGEVIRIDGAARLQPR